ncbi:type II toxin-antitoxin system RelE/ParE family toxin [Simkania negevensis]|uniref:Type II toxin-antitoxin system RelE/ParE family toxin n=1 Tax=Simkania negevensis TaxID=83561 RepID=A0ABS3AQV1_9BACT|nr:type II toxin-antitoxin system RelE/ParE family toxin [Simkania negevensis]
MKYHIEVAEKLKKQLVRLPKKVKARIIAKIDSLAENPRPGGCKKLKGSQRSPFYRVRVGEYRIIDSIEDDVLLILVIDIGHRKEVYQ